MTNVHRKYIRNSQFSLSKPNISNETERRLNYRNIHNGKNLSKYSYSRITQTEKPSSGVGAASWRMQPNRKTNSLTRTSQYGMKGSSIQSSSYTSKTWVRRSIDKVDKKSENLQKDEIHLKPYEKEDYGNFSTADKNKNRNQLNRRTSLSSNGNMVWTRESSISSNIDTDQPNNNTSGTNPPIHMLKSKSEENVMTPVKRKFELNPSTVSPRKHKIKYYDRMPNNKTNVKRIKLPPKVDQKDTTENESKNDNNSEMKRNTIKSPVKSTPIKTSKDNPRISSRTCTPALTPFAYRGVSSKVRQQIQPMSKNRTLIKNKHNNQTSNSISQNHPRTMKLIRIAQTSSTPICPFGSKCLLPMCTKRHDIPIEATKPTCQFFEQNGMCWRGKECPFRHVKVTQGAGECVNFIKYGYCENMNCELRHVKPKISDTMKNSKSLGDRKNFSYRKSKN